MRQQKGAAPERPAGHNKRIASTMGKEPGWQGNRKGKTEGDEPCQAEEPKGYKGDEPNPPPAYIRFSSG
ncbi:hypothetical protein MA16_Dca024587 [Dendrobium catenatum]|uniref:Uncharacterized protein n=1 Tax=Dendrobium catenatum TaxID=906689 RepID=A0A2I0WWT2_9ASPA|nr:hypothetical protein MA16_Dca024587 [Dendrobium catenatum]